MAESVGIMSLTPQRCPVTVDPCGPAPWSSWPSKACNPSMWWGPTRSSTAPPVSCAPPPALRGTPSRWSPWTVAPSAVRAASNSAPPSCPTPGNTLTPSSCPAATALGPRRPGASCRWVRAVAARSRRVATGQCSGTFIAAEAGLLDGRRATTHWARAEGCAGTTEVTVDADPIYVADGKYWSSAGVTAGIDLCLALVEEDYGVDVAQTVARWLVMFLHRPGSQTQFASPVWLPRAERSTVRAVQTLIETARRRSPPSALAGDGRHEPAPLRPVFTEEVGETPGRFVERVRNEAARHQRRDDGRHPGPSCRAPLRLRHSRDAPVDPFQRRMAVSPDCLPA